MAEIRNCKAWHQAASWLDTQGHADKSTQDAAGMVNLASKYTFGLTGRILGGLLFT